MTNLKIPVHNPTTPQASSLTWWPPWPRPWRRCSASWVTAPAGPSAGAWSWWWTAPRSPETPETSSTPPALRRLSKKVRVYLSEEGQMVKCQFLKMDPWTMNSLFDWPSDFRIPPKEAKGRDVELVRVSRSYPRIFRLNLRSSDPRLIL